MAPTRQLVLVLVICVLCVSVTLLAGYLRDLWSCIVELKGSPHVKRTGLLTFEGRTFLSACEPWLAYIALADYARGLHRVFPTSMSVYAAEDAVAAGLQWLLAAQAPVHALQQRAVWPARVKLGFGDAFVDEATTLVHSAMCLQKSAPALAMSADALRFDPVASRDTMLALGDKLARWVSAGRTKLARGEVFSDNGLAF